MTPGFQPYAWPEDRVPPGASGCHRCELRDQAARMVWGEGNPEAPVVAILDNPGAREDNDGNSYVCGTRQTLQLAVHEAGLAMEDLYVTYVLKCRPLRRYDKEHARASCIGYLFEQIGRQRPEIAVCLGTTAVRCFFGIPDLEVKSARGAWHSVRGIPTIVTYHPLAVRRRPNLYRQFLSDWDRLAGRLNELRSNGA